MWAKYIFIFLLSSLFILPVGAKAQTLENGTYKIPYEVKKSGESSTSIANDYFQKPAILIVSNQKMYLEITILKSHWTKEVTFDGNKETLVKTNKEKDMRTIQFPLKQISGKHKGTLAVYINEKVDGEDFLYDNRYEIGFVLDENKLAKQSNHVKEIKIIEKKQTKEQPMSWWVYVISAMVFFLIVAIVGKQIRGRKE